MKQNQGRPGEKIQLHQRPFATIPYLGRGSCNPEIESKLLKGQDVFQKKSEGTVTEKSFEEVSLYPVDSEMKRRVTDASHTVEEAALDGWVRGGANTRHMNADGRMKK